MAALGIGDDDVVVAYDDQGGIMAARLVWMLRATGHEAALLDGGIAAWDGPLETETPPRPPAAFTARPFAGVASIDDAADRANVVVDARQRERFHGAPHPLDVRFGHIPGARSLPCRENLPKTAACSRPTRCARSSSSRHRRRRRRSSPTAARA